MCVGGGGREGNTLYRPFEKGFAGLTRSHAIVISRGYISTDQTQPFGDGVQHVFALNGRVLHDGAGAVVVALTAGSAPQASGREHGRRVQAVGVAVHGPGVAATGIRVAAGAVVADRVDDGGGARRLSLDVGATAGGQMPVICGHSIQQPGGVGSRDKCEEESSGRGISISLLFTPSISVSPPAPTTI